jgi:HSP20 family protein
MSLIPWKNKGLKQGDGSIENTLARFRDEVEGVFDRFVRDDWGQSPMETFPARFGWGPRMDLTETADQVLITAELPGMSPEDVDVDVSGNMLTIRGEKRDEWEGRDAGRHLVERRFGSFQRSVQLPSTVDADKVDAVYKNGVLTITLGKKEEAKPKKISVRND